MFEQTARVVMIRRTKSLASGERRPESLTGLWPIAWVAEASQRPTLGFGTCIGLEFPR
jgi:hypothetical protein